MSKRLLRGALSVAVLAGATAVGFQLATGSAAADSAVFLPVQSAGDLVVDGENKQIFISDPVAGTLITTDYAGKVLNTATGLPGIRDLHLSDRLYATVPGAGTITAFTRATSAKDADYRIGDSQPLSLAQDGHKIWFGQDNAGLGYLDLSGEASQPAPKTGQPSWSRAPRIATTPSRPGVAAVMAPGSYWTLQLLDLTTSPPTVLASRPLSNGSVRDLDFNADGSRLLASGIENTIAELSPTTLETVATYEHGLDWTGDLAVRGDGAFAVGFESDAEGAVKLYTPGSAAPAKSLDLRATPDEQNPLSLTSILSHTLAWEPGGVRLFGVAEKSTTNAGQSSTFSLQVLNDPAKTAVTAQLSMPATATLNTWYRIDGILRPAPAGLPLTITRTDAAGSRRIGPETVPDSGYFEFQDQQAVAGTVTYTLSFAGNDEFAATTTTQSITVGPLPKEPTLTMHTGFGGNVFGYGATAQIQVSLKGTVSNRVVEIWADPYGNDQPNRLVRKAAVDGKGFLTASFKVTRNTTFSAIFRGDSGTNARTIRTTVSTRASVSGTLTRHYKTGKIGSTSYQYFRTSKLPVLNIAVSPYPNRKAYTEIHRYQGGKWVLWSGSLDKLDKAGKAKRSVYTMTKGARFRIRTGYAYGKSGDTANASTYSPWRYYTITR